MDSAMRARKLAGCPEAARVVSGRYSMGSATACQVKGRAVG